MVIVNGNSSETQIRCQQQNLSLNREVNFKLVIPNHKSCDWPAAYRLEIKLK